MTIRTHVKDANTWRAIETIHVQIGEEWKRTKGGWVKENGSLLLTHIPTVRYTFTANYNDLNALNFANFFLGYETVLPVRLILTIPAGITIGQSYSYSGSRPNEVQTKNSPAAIYVAGMPAGSEVIIYNDGYISGCGGQGGANRTPINGGARGTQWAGGDAIAINQTGVGVHIVNNGTIQGGGGGGAGGDWSGDNSIGGGGGAGSDGGRGGAGYSGNRNYGVNGTLTTGGQGTHNSYNSWGGNAGMPGKYGGNFNSTGQVGQPGACVVGNQYIYWWATGNRLGPIIQ